MHASSIRSLDDAPNALRPREVPAQANPGGPTSGHRKTRAWYERLLSDSRELVQGLLEEPLQSAGELRQQVERYTARVLDTEAPLADLRQARALSRATLALLEQTAGGSEAERRMAQVVARYFVMESDGADDLASPYGFDDDVEVYNAVVDALGLADQALPY